MRSYIEVKILMNEEFIKSILSSIVDCIESAFSAVTLIQGKKTRYVFYFCVVATALSEVFNLLGYYTFISLPEGIIATIFAFLMMLLGYRNTKELKDIKLKFKKGVKKHER